MNSNPIHWTIEQLTNELEDQLTSSRLTDVRHYLREDERGLAFDTLTYALSGEEDFDPVPLTVHQQRAIIAVQRVFSEAGFPDHLDLDLDIDSPDRFICPVCEYPGLDVPPDHAVACPCCGFETLETAASNESHRTRWIAGGKRWSHPAGPLPGWNSDAQLDNLSRPDRSAIVHRLRAAGCVFAEEEAMVVLRAASEGRDIDAVVARRAAGEPLEHIVGYAEFSGLRVHVEAGVFIPRRQTEALVTTAARRADSETVFLDLCTGSGAVAAALACIFPDAEVHAADIDPEAVACARRNVDHVHRADLFDGLPEQLRLRIGVVTANVPYVPTAELDTMPVEARVHEPAATHDGGADGHDVLRRLLAAAPHWVKPGGLVVTEIADGQAVTARDVFVNAGFDVEIITTGAYDTTVAVGSVPSP